MTYAEQENNGFDLIVGAFIKCPKGRWQKDDTDLKTGPDGVRATILMQTARHGGIAFDKSGGEDAVVPVIGSLRPYTDCDPSREKLPEGVSPYTIFQLLVDGELCTFAASSWGARKSFKKLVDQQRYVHPREFPIVTLGTTATDANGNCAPTFTPVAWAPISEFSAMLDASRTPQLPAPAEPPRKLQTVTSEVPPIAEDDHNLARAIGDDIPF